MLNFFAAGCGLSLPADVGSRQTMEDRLAARLRAKEATESFCSFAMLLAERMQARRNELPEDPERWDGMG